MSAGLQQGLGELDAGPPAGPFARFPMNWLVIHVLPWPKGKAKSPREFLGAIRVLSMKNLLQTHSVSWAQSVRLTLESEGVPAVVLDENAPGYMGFAGRVRVAVLNDGDLARAKLILSRIAPPVVQAPPSWRVQKRGLMLLAVGFVLFVSSLVVFNQDGPRLLGYAIMATSVAAFVFGFVLIAIGPRADRQGP